MRQLCTKRGTSREGRFWDGIHYDTFILCSFCHFVPSEKREINSWYSWLTNYNKLTLGLTRLPQLSQLSHLCDLGDSLGEQLRCDVLWLCGFAQRGHSVGFADSNCFASVSIGFSGSGHSQGTMEVVRLIWSISCWFEHKQNINRTPSSRAVCVCRPVDKGRWRRLSLQSKGSTALSWFHSPRQPHAAALSLKIFPWESSMEFHLWVRAEAYTQCYSTIWIATLYCHYANTHQQRHTWHTFEVFQGGKSWTNMAKLQISTTQFRSKTNRGNFEKLWETDTAELKLTRNSNSDRDAEALLKQQRQRQRQIFRLEWHQNAINMKSTPTQSESSVQLSNPFNSINSKILLSSWVKRLQESCLHGSVIHLDILTRQNEIKMRSWRTNPSSQTE